MFKNDTAWLNNNLVYTAAVFLKIFRCKFY